MTPEAIQDPELSPAGMGEFSRITGVFFEPAKTFEDVARRPTFIVPLLLIILFATAFTTVYSQRIGWERFMRHQMETNSRMQQLPPEQREQILASQIKMAPVFGYIGPLCFVPISYLFSAAVLMAMTAMMSAGLRFKQVFAVMCYAGLTSLVYSLLSIIVVFLKNPDDFNMQNPLAFNPGAFLDPSGPKFMYSLAMSMDIFSFWNIFLIATGLKAAAGKRLSFGGALMAVVIPWAIYVFGKAAVAGMFS